MATLNNSLTEAGTGDQTSYSSSFVSTAYGDIHIVFWAVTGYTGNPVCSPVYFVANRSGFLLVGRSTWGAGANTLFAYIGGGLLPTISIAGAGSTINVAPITATGSADGSAMVSGMSNVGLGAVRQYVALSSQTAGTTPQVVFPRACLVDNPVCAFIACSTNPPALTPPSGFGTVGDTGFASPTTGVHFSFAYQGALYLSPLGGFSGTTLTWGSTCATEYAVIALELDTSGPVGYGNHPWIVEGWGAT